MIIIGADHAGFETKNELIKYFKKENIDYFDVTDYEINLDDDYVDVAEVLCTKVLQDKENFGIAICGTGVGICIACNKIKGIRAGNLFDRQIAKLLREHNNCNVICFGGRLGRSIEDMIYCINEYMMSKFQGERHQRRIDKIRKLEEKFGDNK